MAKQELTLAAYSVLMVLGTVAGSTQRQLASAVGIDLRNLVPILDDLQSRGFLIRDQHPQDRRRRAVRLSPSGRAKLSRLREVGARAESELLQRLSVTERKQLHRLLAKLR